MKRIPPMYIAGLNRHDLEFITTVLIRERDGMDPHTSSNATFARCARLLGYWLDKNGELAYSPPPPHAVVFGQLP